MGAWCVWGKHITINVNLAQLAANLREWYPEIEVRVLDCHALEMDEKAMVKAVSEINPDLIYMGDALQTNGVAAIAPRHQQAARLIKEQIPEVKICVGGFFYGASAPELLPQMPEFDFMVYGETEVTVPELAYELSKNDPDIPSVKGLTYRINGEIGVTAYRPLFQNLDDLPLPAYDLFPIEKYIGFSYVERYVETYHSRGCPNGCRFCVGWSNYDPRGNRDWTCYRYRSGKRVAEEFELLQKKYGVKCITIMDEDFNVERKRMEEFFEELKKRGVHIPYYMLGRAAYFLRDQDILKEYRKSGMMSALVGMEAVDDETLKMINKGTTVDEVKEVVDKFRSEDIVSIVSWMVGFPDDDEKRIKDRFERIDLMDPDITALQILTPLPSIPMYKEVEPYIVDHDLSKWDFHHAVVRTKHLSREDLGRLAAWANREFYSRPGRIQRVLYNKKYHEYAKLCFRSYIETISSFERAAKEGQRFI
jgi:radical SAM superfamily enzyme YgiQ (UPF0313 family)